MGGLGVAYWGVLRAKAVKRAGPVLLLLLLLRAPRAGGGGGGGGRGGGGGGGATEPALALGGVAGISNLRGRPRAKWRRRTNSASSTIQYDPKSSS